MQPNNGIGGGPQWANPQGTQQQSTISLGQQEQEFFAPLSTLDEPVKETIMRDVRSVASKLKVVLLPMDRTVRGVKQSCWMDAAPGDIAQCSHSVGILVCPCSYLMEDMLEWLNQKISN